MVVLALIAMLTITFMVGEVIWTSGIQIVSVNLEHEACLHHACDVLCTLTNKVRREMLRGFISGLYSR